MAFKLADGWLGRLEGAVYTPAGQIANEGKGEGFCAAWRGLGRGHSAVTPRSPRGAQRFAVGSFSSLRYPSGNVWVVVSSRTRSILWMTKANASVGELSQPSTEKTLRLQEPLPV